jgi:hypothetical protein
VVASDLQLLSAFLRLNDYYILDSGFILILEQNFMIDNNLIHQEETLKLLFAYEVVWLYA